MSNQPEKEQLSAGALKYELGQKIVAQIEEFERATGFTVCRDIELNRGGSTDRPPFRIFGIHIKVY